MPRRKSFGGVKFSFRSVKDVTLGEVFGSSKLTPSTVVKKLFAFVKSRGLAEKDSGKRARIAELRMIRKTWVPTRGGVSEQLVCTIVSEIDERNLDLVEQAKRRPGAPFVVGGDARLNEPPYIFRFNAELGDFDDNISETPFDECSMFGG